MAYTIRLQFSEGFELPPKKVGVKLDLENGGKKTFLDRRPPIIEVELKRKLEHDKFPDNTQLVVDSSTKIEEYKRRAQLLKHMQEMGRLFELIKMVRKALKYPYPDDREKYELFNKLENEAKESMDGYEKLSNFVEARIGKCRHFSALYQLLGIEAGLVVTYQAVDATNAINPATGSPLFTLVDIGKEQRHAVNEVYIKAEDIWIPVDPTANFVGNEKAKRDAFERNYMITWGPYVIPSYGQCAEMPFIIGRKTFTVRIIINELTDQPIIFDHEVVFVKPLVEGVIAEIV